MPQGFAKTGETWGILFSGGWPFDVAQGVLLRCLRESGRRIVETQASAGLSLVIWLNLMQFLADGLVSVRTLLWAEKERSHGGVIFVDEKTISPADIGGLVRALISLVDDAGRMTGPIRCTSCEADAAASPMIEYNL